MTAPDGFDRLITTWLDELAPMREPDGLLETVTGRIERSRRRPSWALLERWLPMQTTAKFGAIPRTALILVTLGILALILTAVAIGAQPSRLPPPFGVARNGSIAYSVNGDIYLAGADGSNPHAIITGPDNDRYPWFSQDGTKLSFGRGEDADLTLMVADADGGNPQPLMDKAVWSEFMPLGNQLLVTHGDPGHLVMSIIDLGGSHAVTDLDVLGIELRGWAQPRPPDGAELIFTGRPHPGTKDVGLFAIRPDDHSIRTIGAVSTTETGDTSGGAGAHVSFQDPSISADGSRIIYWDRDPDANGSDPYLHQRDLATGEDLPVPVRGDDFRMMVLPHVSPDGTMVVYETRGSSGSNQQLFYGPIDGSQPSRPIGPEFSNVDRQGFDFSPDGTEVFLTAGTPPVTMIIDIATNQTTTIDAITAVPGWQRLAP
jgi:hypothetical protein